LPDIVCSLINKDGQNIPPGDSYTLLRFPFVQDGESYDAHDMHPAVQPDTGQMVGFSSQRAGLIWPVHDAWAHLHALLYWDAGSYTEVRSRFVRDPLAIFGDPDSTCTEDHPATPGQQFRPKNWAMFVHPMIPLGLMVRHNASGPVKLLLAEFKVSYHRDPEPQT
jgi:hypothetical protein